MVISNTFCPLSQIEGPGHGPWLMKDMRLCLDHVWLQVPQLYKLSETCQIQWPQSPIAALSLDLSSTQTNHLQKDG